MKMKTIVVAGGAGAMGRITVRDLVETAPQNIDIVIADYNVKAATALRDRRTRDETGLTLVDGVRELARALAGGARAVEVFVVEHALDEEGLDAFRETKHVHLDYYGDKKYYWFPNKTRENEIPK